MPKNTWNIMLDGQNFEVQADVGRKQRVWVNGESVLDQRTTAFGAQDYKFMINGHPAYVRMKQGMLKSSLDLVIDGVSAETGEAMQEMGPMPWWGWIFVVACAAMVVMGGALPIAIGFGSAAGVYSIMRNPKYDTMQRLGFSGAITVGAWIIMIIVVVAISSAL